jgi:hypothetical protein
VCEPATCLNPQVRGRSPENRRPKKYPSRDLAWFRDRKVPEFDAKLLAREFVRLLDIAIRLCTEEREDRRARSGRLRILGSDDGLGQGCRAARAGEAGSELSGVQITDTRSHDS